MKKTVIFVVLSLFLFAGHASAHKVIIFAWVENNMIHTQSRFASKRKAKNCVIKVVNEKGAVIHKGKTDSKGEYSFKIPDNIDSDIVVRLEAGTGHQAHWTITEDELAAASTPEDIQAAMKEKENLEKKPSILKIITGIVLIFLLAFGVKVFKKRQNNND